MALTDFKITDLDVSGKGVVAAPDQLSGTAAENKKIFDRLIREVVKEEHNGLIDALAELGVQQLVQYGTENVKHIRLNADENIEISADGEAWTTVASSGHIIFDSEGNQAPQRGRLKFAGETTVTDEDGCTVVRGIMGPNVKYTPQTLTAAQKEQACENLGLSGAVKYNTPQTLTAEQKEQAQKNIGVTWPCNPNLLDNWYFGNPVNQRGQTSYSGDAYFVDRWATESGVTATVSGSGLAIASSSGLGILQRHNHSASINGKTGTVSIFTSDGNVAASMLTIGDCGGGVAVGDAMAYSTAGTALYLRPKSDVSSVTILAVKLELGTEQTLAHQDAEGNWALNEIPDYHTELLKCIQSTADPNDTYANKVVTTMDRVVNPNLLDNWYFINPVNQRGETSFASDTTYTIDRWRQYKGRSVLNSLTTEGFQLTTVNGVTQGLVQSILATQMPSGRVYTLSALLKIVSDTSSDNSNANVALSYGSSANTNNGSKYVPKTQPIGQWFVHTFTFTFPEATDETVNVRLRLSSAGDTTVVVRAMKLELGSEQTLAHQDADGNWVLNEIPDYGEQLARCRRYYRKTVHAMFPACAPQAGLVTFGVDISEMRTSPVVTDAQVYVQAFLNGKSYTSDSVSIVPMNPHEGYMSVQVSNVPVNSSGTIVISTFELSADL